MDHHDSHVGAGTPASDNGHHSHEGTDAGAVTRAQLNVVTLLTVLGPRRRSGYSRLGGQPLLQRRGCRRGNHAAGYGDEPRYTSGCDARDGCGRPNR